MRFFLACLCAVLSNATLAQEYPLRPIRIVVPFAPGGMVDTSGRIVADRLAARLGQPLLMDNRPGAAGNIAHDFVAKAPPDGYTLLLTFEGPMVINPHVYKNLSWDTFRDFQPVTKLNDAALILVAHPSFAAINVKDMIAKAKTLGRVPYGTAGNATTQHVAMELFKQHVAGLDLVHVPYKGGAPATADVVGGQIPVAYVAIATAQAFVVSGKLRALGVSSAQRAPTMPQVPTFVESGLPGFVVDSWIALFAPANTPRAIIDKVQRETAIVLAQPEVRERYAALGLLPGGGTPEQLAAQMKEEYSRWEKVVRDAGISIQ